ncbi:putative sodium-dependent multivitamin transporter [Chironomus tepperi]|uniref:putative sodium-dependent multivitamin transporter n=1 Tax=Chironomus tepperi TaxID=113505 RepID=UPI00391EF270
MAFGVWDYVVFGITLIISAAIGVYARFSGGRQKTNQEYLLANRSMPIWPVSFSLMASFMSAVTLLGVSNENYQFGTQFVVINISYGLATPICAYLFLPVFYNMGVTSAYEYLEKRFGLLTRLVASLSYTIQMVLYMGIALFAPALAMETVTGIKMNYAIILIGGVCSFYSIIGGLKAVLLTDVFQSILMFAAVLIVGISGIAYAGSMSEIFRVANEGGRLQLWNFDPDPTVRHTWFTLVIGGMGTYLSLYGVSQAQIQRLVSVKTLKNAQLSLWWQWPILSSLSLTTSFSGLVIYWYYSTCDPLLAGRINSRDQNMPRYIMDALKDYPGIAGLFVAGIFSACLSTVSTALNSLSAITLEDYFKNIYLFIKKKPYEPSVRDSALISKVLATCYGVICILVAFLTQNLGGVLQASLTIFGVVGGPLLGVFTLGMFTKVANQWGVITGHIIGMAVAMWSQFGKPRPPAPVLDFSIEDCSAFEGFQYNSTVPIGTSDDEEPTYFYLYRLSYMYAVVLGFLLTLIVGYVTSYILYWTKLQNMHKIYVKGSVNEINVNLFVPPLARLYKRHNDEKRDIR